ncbi:DNA repair protein RecN [Clostridium tarantellae]|uniref:DNA repair protein RecN n=1 Tax=Clostridium tarantellae TaxID=39493 RepID=A0A6I1MJZ5_9CLOT|nr:DNA repair protein RecN [Clostridium tarantellae]MPQ42748.1 DNA repair protein RecN [Clostridium tarantellae]
MLLQLSINNFALIESLSLDFKKGFTILSGETGAGKSILIDAINYVLGSKFNKGTIRTGEDKAFVEAIFDIENNANVKSILNELNIEYDDIIIISRETFQNGKSIIKINGKSVILSVLKKVSEKLVDIHGQHNNHTLLNKENHIIYLDSFAWNDLKDKLNLYKDSYIKLKDIDNKIKELSKEGKNEKLISYIEYQIKEIEEAKLIDGEEEELNEQYNILFNSEKIRNALSLSYNLFNSSQRDNSILDSISTITKELSLIENHSEKIKTLNEKINNIFYDLQEISIDIRDISENISYNEQELEEINSRIYKISILKKKYGVSIKEILKYKLDLEKQYDEMINSEKILEKLYLQKNSIINDLQKISEYLTQIRCKSACILEEKIQSELEYVGLGKCKFKVSVENSEEFNALGKNIVQFLISTNPGEPMRSMGKIVSGGELSRIMLSMKTVFINKDKIPTVIFDEIDTGISGRIAQCVAEKMYQISTKHQVFCITHLPQITSMSDNHYIVKKNITNEKTFTSVEPIGEKDKIVEIAKMLGGVELTENTLLNAEEMIRLAANKKRYIIDNNT